MPQVVTALVEDGDKIFIAQRSKDDELPLMWEFPGGKVRPGEPSDEAIKREYKEELNLDIEVTGLYSKGVYAFMKWEVEVLMYRAKIVGGELTFNEHNDYTWVTRKELKDYEIIPPYKHFYDQLVAEGEKE